MRHLGVARRHFGRLESAYDAACVGLELAFVYWQQGELDRTRRLAARLVQEFRKEEAASREATAALGLFERAAVATAGL